MKRNRKFFAEQFGLSANWAEGRMTLLDVAIANGADPTVGLIDETAGIFPEIATGAARTIKETSYKTLVCTENPVVGFRDANEAAVQGKGVFENRRYECFIFNPQWLADVAVADRYEDGPEALIALQARTTMNGSLQHLCRQFYYGNDAVGGNDLKGFAGLIKSYDRTKMEVDAGGTNNLTSVYAVRWGAQDVQFLYGGDGQGLNPTQVARIQAPAVGGGFFTAYMQEILAHVGLQVGSTRSVARLKKLGTDVGKGLTDSLLGDLFDVFPAAFPPDAFFCTKRSLGQLRKSRTATNPTGQEAPYPKDWNGIPIIVTDAISNAEDAAW